MAQGSWACEMRFWRFLGNPRVTIARLIEGWGSETREAVAGQHILAVQDTSELRFSTTKENQRGLGQVKKGSCRGVVLHTMVALDAANGSLRGLVSGDVWTRSDAVKIDHRKRQIAEKESHRWITTAKAAEEVLAKASMITVIDDREGDIYAHWARTPHDKVHLLARAMQDHRVVEGGTLFKYANSTPFCAEAVIKLRTRDGRPGRDAHLSLRFGAIEMRRPKGCLEDDLPESVSLNFVEVIELHPPRGCEPVRWMLLTTHAVSDAAKAWQIVDWYRMRWTIEQFFRTMKTMGLQVEDSQLQSADRLIKIVAIAAKAAAIVMQLVQGRDGADDRPARDVFTVDEIRALETLAKRLEGRTNLQKNHHPHRSLAWASWIIAKLGGWSGYASHRPPGPITMHNGLKYFRAYADGWAANV